MRGKAAPKRKILPDPKYGSTVIAKFVNYIMERGKKGTAQRIVYGAFDSVSQKLGQNAQEIFDQAIKNIAPTIEIKGRRIGGANYQVPIPVRGDRKYSLAFRWLIGAARSRKGKPMAEKLANEIMQAFNKEGDAIKKRNDVHKMAEANRAFAHFAQFGSRKKK